MQETELIMEESYIDEMEGYFEKQGKQLQGMVDSYIASIKKIVEEGIEEGETSETLRAFLEYAEKLDQVIAFTAGEVKNSIENYLEEINTEDQYLY